MRKKKYELVLKRGVMAKALILSLTLAFVGLVMPGAQALMVSSTDVPVVIPDGDSTGIISTIDVGADLVLTDVNLIFDYLQHTFLPDLHVELISPDGTVSTILHAWSESPAGILPFSPWPRPAGDFVGTVLDDDALTSLADPGESEPYTGSFNVDHAPSSVFQPLSVFDGENAFGTWTLFVSDLAGIDTGVLHAWSLELEGRPGGDEIPEPASMTLIGLGLVGFGVRRFRKRA